MINIRAPISSLCSSHRSYQLLYFAAWPFGACRLPISHRCKSFARSELPFRHRRKFLLLRVSLASSMLGLRVSASIAFWNGLL